MNFEENTGIKEKPERAHEHPGRVHERRSASQIKEIGAQRLENARAKVGSFFSSIKNRFRGALSKTKNLSLDAARMVLAAPELAQEAGLRSIDAAGRAKEAVVDAGKATIKKGQEIALGGTRAVSDGIEAAGVALSAVKKLAVDKAVKGWERIEERGVAAYDKFKSRVEAARQRALERKQKVYMEKFKQQHDALVRFAEEGKKLGFDMQFNEIAFWKKPKPERS